MTMTKADQEDQMMRANEQRKERTLTDRLKLRQLGCLTELLEKIESYGDQLMDHAVELNREIQKMKEAMKKC